MRSWQVDPKFLCRKHLLGEHVEIHMFVGTINKNISMKGYIEKGLVDPSKLTSRHQELVSEMKSRGYNHKSELIEFSCNQVGYVDIENNIIELSKRCPNCCERINRT